MSTRSSIYYEEGRTSGAPHLYFDPATGRISLNFFTTDYQDGGEWFTVDLPDAMCEALAEYIVARKARTPLIPPCPTTPHQLRMKSAKLQNFKVGDTVMVHDRYRLAVPHKARIVRIGEAKHRGVVVDFLDETPQVISWRQARNEHERRVRENGSPDYITNREFWVDMAQIEFAIPEQ